jgi:hypothetical protein
MFEQRLDSLLLRVDALSESRGQEQAELVRRVAEGERRCAMHGDRSNRVDEPALVDGMLSQRCEEIVLQLGALSRSVEERQATCATEVSSQAATLSELGRSHAEVARKVEELCTQSALTPQGRDMQQAMCEVQQARTHAKEIESRLDALHGDLSRRVEEIAQGFNVAAQHGHRLDGLTAQLDTFARSHSDTLEQRCAELAAQLDTAARKQSDALDQRLSQRLEEMAQGLQLAAQHGDRYEGLAAQLDTFARSHSDTLEQRCAGLAAQLDIVSRTHSDVLLKRSSEHSQLDYRICQLERKPEKTSEATLKEILDQLAMLSDAHTDRGTTWNLQHAELRQQIDELATCNQVRTDLPDRAFVESCCTAVRQELKKDLARLEALQWTGVQNTETIMTDRLNTLIDTFRKEVRNQITQIQDRPGSPDSTLEAKPEASPPLRIKPIAEVSHPLPHTAWSPPLQSSPNPSEIKHGPDQQVNSPVGGHMERLQALVAGLTEQLAPKEGEGGNEIERNIRTAIIGAAVDSRTVPAKEPSALPIEPSALPPSNLQSDEKLQMHTVASTTEATSTPALLSSPRAIDLQANGLSPTPPRLRLQFPTPSSPRGAATTSSISSSPRGMAVLVSNSRPNSPVPSCSTGPRLAFAQPSFSNSASTSVIPDVVAMVRNDMANAKAHAVTNEACQSPSPRRDFLSASTSAISPRTFDATFAALAKASLASKQLALSVEAVPERATPEGSNFQGIAPHSSSACSAGVRGVCFGAPTVSAFGLDPIPIGTARASSQSPARAAIARSFGAAAASSQLASTQRLVGPCIAPGVPGLAGVASPRTSPRGHPVLTTGVSAAREISPRPHTAFQNAISSLRVGASSSFG